MTTNQTERVSDEELDQMIWKLERDGMTPKQLSLMIELREVRRAVTPTDDERIMAIEGIAPPAPVVPDAYIRDERQRMMLNGKCEPKIGFAAGWNACRAAMLQLSGNSEQLEPVSNRDELMPGIKPAPELDSVAKNAESLPGNSPATPDGWVMVPVEPTYQMCQAMALSWESPRFPDRYKAMIEAAPDFRENVNSSTRYFLEISETSTNCPKCGGRGTYHCPQMLGTVECECECTLSAAPKEVR